MVKKTEILEIKLSKEWKHSIVKALVSTVENRSNDIMLNNKTKKPSNLKKRIEIKMLKTIDSKIKFFAGNSLKKLDEK